jgi:hypothetical protein
MKFPNIVKKCESELLSLPVKPFKDEIEEYLFYQNKYRKKYFNLAFGKSKHKKLFIKKFYPPLPKYNYNLKIDEIENWEQKYYLLVRAFESTGAII